MNSFHTDSPITGAADNPDRLNRMEFSRRVGELLKMKASFGPLVVSLEGPWGYGKTSVINLIKKYYESLEKSDRPIVVDFNPWMTGTSEHIVKEFLVQFGSAVGLGAAGKYAKEAAKQLLAYSKVFDVLKWVPGAEPWASIAEKVMTGVGTATVNIADLKSLNIIQHRDAVVKALGKVGRPITVFIDDLDRLPPLELYHMIGAVKAITDFPGTAFLLAFERSYVDHTLKRNGIRDSGAYLDKIIQVRLHLPVISEQDIHKLVIEELNNLSDIDLTSFFEGDKSRLSEIYNLCIKPMIRTPRDLKRLFNRLRFIEPSLRHNVCFSDIFALETIAIKAPRVYEHIRSTPWAYTGREPDYKFSLSKPEEIIEKYGKERQDVLDTVSKEDRQYVRDLIGELFPRVGYALGRGSVEYEYGYRHGLVASPDRLRFATTFGLPSGEIPSEWIARFLKNPEDRKEIIEEIKTEDLAERFIDLLLMAAKHEPPSEPLEFMRSVSVISGLPVVLRVQEKPRDFLEVNPARQLWWIIEFVLERSSREERAGALFEIARSPDCLSVSAYALDHSLRQHGFFEKKDEISPDKRWLDNAQLEELKDAWMVSVEQAARKNTFFDTADRAYVSYMLIRLKHPKAEGLINAVMKRDSDLDSLVMAIGRTGQDSVKGEYSEISEYVVNGLGGTEKVQERVRKRLKAALDNTALRAIYNSILTGTGYYLIDNTKRRD